MYLSSWRWTFQSSGKFDLLIYIIALLMFCLHFPLEKTRCDDLDCLSTSSSLPVSLLSNPRISRSTLLIFHHSINFPFILTSPFAFVQLVWPLIQTWLASPSLTLALTHSESLLSLTSFLTLLLIFIPLFHTHILYFLSIYIRLCCLSSRTYLIC